MSEISHARVVIVGGGMMGASLLYYLAEEGWTDTVLVEKGELTSGSTWHAAGLCPSFIGDYSMAFIHHVGNTLYPTLEEKTGQYVGWHGCGGIRLATTEEELDWFKHVADIAKNVGYGMEVIGPDKIREINPFINTDGVVAGAWTLDDGHVDPAGCCNALAKGARDMGASVQRHNRVVEINARQSGEWEVVTEKGTIIAEHVVNSAGCYARKVSQMVGSDAPIINMQHQYFVTDPVDEFIQSDGELPVFRDPYSSSYYRQEQKAALIGPYETSQSVEAWASTGGVPEWDSENELFDADYDRVMPFLERVFGRMPIWAEKGIKRVVNGAIPHTPDGNPLLGPAGGVKNFWMCNGSAIGIAQGAGCGKYLAQWMVHGASDINMSNLDARRFGTWADETYSRAKAFDEYHHMYALHIPGEERDIGRGLRKTPIHDRLAAEGCVHTAAFGWERPKWFSPDGRDEELSFRRNNVFEVVAEECKAVAERVGVLELSSFAKFEVIGPDAEAFLNRVFANRMARKVGGISLAHMLNDGGRIQTEATITRIGEERFYVLTGAAWEDRDMDGLQQAVLDGEQVTIANVTDDWGNLVVAGPRARDLLAKITDADLSNEAFRWLTAQEIKVAGVPCRALRVNYVGELGWELHHPMAQMPELYDAIWDAGQEFGIANFGAYAVNSLRIEKAYRGIGAELTNEISPLEADMERFANLDKGEFTGRDAVQRIKQQGMAIKLVYLEVDADDADMIGGEPVYHDGKVVGVTTSGGYGHRTQKSLGFAYVTTELAVAGQGLEVEILEDRRSVKVLSEPAFDPGNAHLRA